VFKNLYKVEGDNKRDILKTGIPVRLQKLKKTFEKGYKTNWTDEVFLIEKILNTTQFQRYTVKDKEGEVLEGSFYKKELQSVDN